MYGIDMAMGCPGVYVITNVVNGKRYVGSSRNVKRRGRKHAWELDKGLHTNEHLLRAWRAYGPTAFLFSVLAYVPIDQLLDCEQRYIDLLGGAGAAGCYNIVPDARRQIVSDETRLKLSQALRGKKKMPLSAEAREKIAAQLRGRTLSPDNITKRKATMAARTPEQRAAIAEKVSAKLRGKPKSEDARRAMSAAKPAYWAQPSPES